MLTRMTIAALRGGGILEVAVAAIPVYLIRALVRGFLR